MSDSSVPSSPVNNVSSAIIASPPINSHENVESIEFSASSQVLGLNNKETESLVCQSVKIACKCGGNKERKGNRGTVQCSKCNSWSHLACYNLLTKETRKDSYTFTCSKCNTISLDKNVTSPRVCTNTNSSILGHVHDIGQTLSGSHPTPQSEDSNTKQLCSCSEVPALKQEIKHLTSEIKSIQLQFLALSEELNTLRNGNRRRPISRPDSQPSSHASAPPWPVDRPTNTGALVYKRLGGGSTSYFLSPKRPGKDSFHPARSSSTTSSSRTYRIIWGTRLNTDESFVAHKLASCLDDEDTPKLQIKKTVKQNQNGKTNWWFTVIAPENIISKISSSWPSLNKQWSLCKALNERPRPRLGQGTSTTSTGSRSRSREHVHDSRGEPATDHEDPDISANSRSKSPIPSHSSSSSRSQSPIRNNTPSFPDRDLSQPPSQKDSIANHKDLEARPFQFSDSSLPPPTQPPFLDRHWRLPPVLITHHSQMVPPLHPKRRHPSV